MNHIAWRLQHTTDHSIIWLILMKIGVMPDLKLNNFVTSPVSFAFFSLFQVITICKADDVSKLSSTTYFFYNTHFVLSLFFGGGGQLAVLALPIRWGRKLKDIGQIFSLIKLILKFQYLEKVNLIYNFLMYLFIYFWLHWVFIAAHGLPFSCGTQAQ